MEVLHLSKNTDYYFFHFKIWNRRNRIRIMSDSESEIKQLFGLMTDYLKLIDKNKDKIAHKIYENRYATDYQYIDDLIDMETYSNTPFQHFVNGLYISNVRIELYKIWNLMSYLLSNQSTDIELILERNVYFTSIIALRYDAYLSF